MNRASKLAAALLEDNTWRRKDLAWVRESLGCTPLIDTARKVAEELTAAGIPHLIIGGLAVQQDGYVRTTLDVDGLRGRLKILSMASPARPALHHLGLDLNRESPPRPVHRSDGPTASN